MRSVMKYHRVIVGVMSRIELIRRVSKCIKVASGNSDVFLSSSRNSEHGGAVAALKIDISWPSRRLAGGNKAGSIWRVAVEAWHEKAAKWREK